MTDRYVGDINATVHPQGRVALSVTPGPLRVSRLVLSDAHPEFLTQDHDLVTFHDTLDGKDYPYRIVGDEPGPEGGWLLCEPLP